ncbi:MAG: glycosyltransferase, partial [Lactococcus lactis]|nr:glycosyltransferase [Lactococcus lactis]
MFIEDKSSDNIFFSIITPNYNSGGKILRAIESLKSNSISYEHIIIDDCSTDDSFFSVKRIESANPELVLFDNPANVGPGASRNKGLDVAKGNYIIFLDADDYFLDNALDTLHSIIKSEEKIDVLIFKSYMITNTNDSLNLLNDSGDISLIKDPIHDFLLDKIISSPWGKCIKADLAKSFRFPNLRVSQDAPYNLDIFMSAKNVLKLDSVFYIFD